MKEQLRIPGWRIIRVIGKGSFGSVYEIEKEDEFSGVAHSALKVISIPEHDTDVEEYRQEGYDDVSLTALFKSQVEDITSEFRLMSKLKGHSNIVSFEDYLIVQHEDSPGFDIYIRMELLTPLMKAYEQELNEHGCSDGYVQRVGIDICRALERCGRHNIIHRDIKPQNIFVNEEGDFKLGDFGIAKTSDHTTRATKTGTYNYMAPEVYRTLPYSASVDIYSLGLVLYWMLNERRGPFVPLPPEVPKPSQNAEALERRMRGEPLPPPKNGSEELKRIVLKACAFDPKDRYQRPVEMRRDLERAAMGQSETQTASPVFTFETSESANAYEATVGAYRKETDADHTVSAMSEPDKAKEPERPTPVVTSAPVPEVIRPSWPKEAYDATVSMFRAETATGRAYAEDGTIRAAAKPVSEAGEILEDADATVGLFAKRPETVKPPVKKEPERKPEPAPKPEKPAEKPEKPQTDQKSVGKGSKKTLLIIAAAAALAVITAVILIVVLAGKGTSAQQAEAPTAAPTEAPSQPAQTAEQPTSAPTAAATPMPTASPTTEPTLESTSGEASWEKAELEKFTNEAGVEMIIITYRVPSHASIRIAFPDQSDYVPDYVYENTGDETVQRKVSIQTAIFIGSRPDGEYSITPEIKIVWEDGRESSVECPAFLVQIGSETTQSTQTPYSKPTASMEKNAADGYVNADSVEMREGPGTNYNIVNASVERYTVVKLYVEQDGWWFLKCRDQYGYIRKDYIAKGTVPESAETQAYLPLTLSARFLLIILDDQILQIEGRTAPGASLTFVKPDYETVIGYYPSTDAEGLFMYEFKISDSSFRGMTKAEIVAEKDGLQNTAEFVILRGFEDKTAFVKYYNKKYIEINYNDKEIANILGNLTEYAGGKYGFRLTATVEEVFAQDGDAVVKMVIDKTGETVYVRNYSETWRPADNIGGKYYVYCNLIGTYENTGCCEFIGWFARRS